MNPAGWQPVTINLPCGLGVSLKECIRLPLTAMDTDHESADGQAELPTEFAEHAAALTGLDTPPETLEEWWRALAEQYAEGGHSVELSDLYSASPTRHEVHIDDRIRYAYCALDGLLAAVMEDQTSVTVRSIDPDSGTPVVITVTDESVEVSPDGALICFGSTVDEDDTEAAGSIAAWSLQEDRAEVQSAVCQYTNAFESEETYDRWASQTDSFTAPLPPANVVRLVRAFSQELD